MNDGPLIVLLVKDTYILHWPVMFQRRSTYNVQNLNGFVRFLKTCFAYHIQGLYRVSQGLNGISNTYWIFFMNKKATAYVNLNQYLFDVKQNFNHFLKSYFMIYFRTTIAKLPDLYVILYIQVNITIIYICLLNITFLYFTVQSYNLVNYN